MTSLLGKKSLITKLQTIFVFVVMFCTNAQAFAAEENDLPPEITYQSGRGPYPADGLEVEMTVTTNMDAECKHNYADSSYYRYWSNQMTSQDARTHTATVTLYDDYNQSKYIRCKSISTGLVNTTSFKYTIYFGNSAILSQPQNLEADIPLNLDGNFNLTWDAVESAAFYHMMEKRDGEIWKPVALQTGSLNQAFYRPIAGRYLYKLSACTDEERLNCSSFSDEAIVSVGADPTHFPPTINTLSGQGPHPAGVREVEMVIETNLDALCRHKYNSSGVFRYWSADFTSEDKRIHRGKVTLYGDYDVTKYIKCQAIDTGYTHNKSNPFPIYFFDPSVLSSPTGLSVDSDVNNGAYTLSWNQVNGAVSYHLMEKLDARYWVKVSTQQTNLVKSLNKSVDGQYQYQIAACDDLNATSCGRFSEILTVSVSGASEATADDDNDGVINIEDAFPTDPTEWADFDGDGTGDNADLDDDNDSVNDLDDAFPNDASEWLDTDNDSIGNNADADDDNDNVADIDDAFPLDPTEWFDADLDGIGNNADLDDDNDGVLDTDDLFPFDPTESQDNDLDGIGNNADQDDDNDNVLDVNDAFPFDPAESVDTDSDGIGNNADQDDDNDGVLDVNDVFPLDPNESADLDGDGVGDNADTDRDGDGVDNAQDIYPDDNSRSVLENITSLSLTLNEKSLVLNWQAVAVDTLVTGYKIYRADFNVADVNGNDLNVTFTELTTLDKTTVEYIDLSVENKKAYQYQIQSFTASDQLSALSNTVSEYVAHNLDPIGQLTVKQTDNQFDLNWQSTNADEYLIYRAQADFAMTLISKVNSDSQVANVIEESSFSDLNVVIGNQYRYQLANRQTFTNPINGETFTLDGPLSAIETVSMVAPLKTLLNAQLISKDTYQVLTNSSAASILVSGQHENNTAPVEMSFVNGAQVITQTTGGQFEIELPVVAAQSNQQDQTSQWIIDSTSAGLTTKVTLNVLLDDLPPLLTVDGSSTRSTENTTVTLTGQVTDGDGSSSGTGGTGSIAGIDSLTLTSDRFASQSFNAVIAADGQFSIEVPVEVGANILSLVATDIAGNQVSQDITVNKEDKLKPVLELTSHTNGQSVTDTSITIIGLVHSQLALAEIKVLLGTTNAQLTAVDDETYRFTFNDIGLIAGDNQFAIKAESSAGNSNLDFVIKLTEEIEVITPVITIQSPLSGSYISNSAFVISGDIYSPSAISSFTINSNAVYLTATDSESYHFNYTVEFGAAGSANANLLNLTATVIAQNGETATQDLTYYQDNTAPVITVGNNLLASPTVNNITQIPFSVSGTVVDDNISSVLLNDQVIDITPGSNPGEYDFDIAVNVEKQVETNFEIKAYDLSGNVTTSQYIVFADSNASIDIIAPSGNIEFVANEANFNLQIIARVKDHMATDKVRVTVNQTAPVFVEISQTLVNTTIMMPATSGEHTVKLELLDENNQVLLISKRKFKIQNMADIPLELQKTEPFNGQTGVEPNNYVSFYFNKPIDQSKLSVTLSETAAGKTYVNEDPRGASFIEAKGHQLKNVIRSNELVPGGLGSVPGDNIMAFYPSRELAYKASIFVSVSYDGEEISRFNYTTRPLPTFLSGSVLDQLGQFVEGVSVSLPELGRSTTTNKDGVFSFGLGDSAAAALPEGRYKIQVNTGFKHPQFGITNRFITIEEGRRNDTGMLRLPVLDKNIAFKPLQGGQVTTFAQGDYKLDLTNAGILYPDNSSQGNVHVSFVQTADADVSVSPIAYPSWLYATQPAGISVTGSPAIELVMPKLYNSYSYVPDNQTYLVIVARNHESNALLPIGVGIVDGYTVKSVGALNLSRLDFIGYAFVPEDKQAVLKRYADGELSLQALIGSLQFN